MDFFSSSPGRGGAELRRMIDQNEPFALTGVVVAEVLQGLTRDAASIAASRAERIFFTRRAPAEFPAARDLKRPKRPVNT